MSLSTLGEARKAVRAAAAGLAVMVAAGLVTGSAAVWLTGLVAAVAAGVAAFAAKPNDDPKGT